MVGELGPKMAVVSWTRSFCSMALLKNVGLLKGHRTFVSIHRATLQEEHLASSYFRGWPEVDQANPPPDMILSGDSMGSIWNTLVEWLKAEGKIRTRNKTTMRTAAAAWCHQMLGDKRVAMWLIRYGDFERATEAMQGSWEHRGPPCRFGPSMFVKVSAILCAHPPEKSFRFATCGRSFGLVHALQDHGRSDLGCFSQRG